MNGSLRLAFFGGTFDPVHQGHLEVAARAVEALQLDHLLFIPCRRSPHKTESPGAGDLDRLRMLQLATRDLPWAKVEDYELKKPPPSYTWETVEYFGKQFPPDAIRFLLIGNDQWESLPRWKNIGHLAREVEFIVVGREKQPTPRDGYTAHFLQGNHPASASAIRRDLARGTVPKWLPRPVARYIREKGLYSPRS